MAETVLFGLARAVLGKVGEILVDEVKLVYGVENELQNLKHNISYIQAVLEDAERMQRTSSSVKIWLRDLESFLYEMDDFLDDLAIEAAIRQKIKDDWSKRVRRFFSPSNSLVLRYKLADHVRNLHQRLELIRKNGKDFRYNPKAGDISVSLPDCQRETSSSLPRWDILGRDGDKRVILDMMSSFRDSESVSVIPIVGSGGLGKTTLAQLIYNDKELKFESKIWVFVSKTFSARKIIGEVIRLTREQENQMNHLSMEEMRIKLMQSIQNQKYLLILDDMWNDNLTEWMKLKNLLDVGANGSCILITTRVVQVASNTSTIVGSSRYHQLKGLSSDVCSSIFRKLVFGDCFYHEDKSKFDKMAEKIVEKSGGVPLILTVLGNLLAANREERKWIEVIHQLEHGFEDINSILKLSYDELSPFLKPCFRITPFYRGDGNSVQVGQLVSVWTALGYINSDSSNGESLEETELKYIKALWSKSLLYGDPNNFDLKIHDCMSDLALSISGNDTVALSNGGASNCSGIDDRVKHILLKYDDESQEMLPPGICKAVKARYFKLIATNHVLEGSLLREIIANFKRLRVLDFSSCDFEELPSCIGSLKHLRMLSLAGNWRIKHLPDSICELLNLQTLHLNGCIQLQKLPVCLGKLTNLRHLKFTTPKEYLPEEIGVLTALRSLCLICCRRLASLPRSLKNLVNLEILSFYGCTRINLCSDASTETLQGFKKLHSLFIVYVFSFRGLPRELGNLVATLERLVISWCFNLEDLAGWIDQFVGLKRLSLRYCPKLKAPSTRFINLNDLEYMEITECQHLREWYKGDGSRLLSHVSVVCIDKEDCLGAVLNMYAAIPLL